MIVRRRASDSGLMRRIFYPDSLISKVTHWLDTNESIVFPMVTAALTFTLLIGALFI